MPKIRLNLREITSINEALRKVLSIKADAFNGEGKALWQFAPGHTDSTIAAQFTLPERPITKDHVAHIRRELFGELIGKASGSNEEVLAQLHALKTKMAELFARQEALHSRMQALEDYVTIPQGQFPANSAAK